VSHRIHSISSIARPLEPQYPTNLAVLILLPLVALGVGGVAFFYHHLPFGDAAMAGLAGMVTAFLAWALGREVDPDRNEAAFVAMAVAVFAVALGWSPALWVLALALMATRVVVRTVGPAARLTDLAFVTLLAGLAVFADGYWAMGFVAAFAMAIDTRFDRSRTLNLVFAAIAFAISIYAVIQHDGAWGALTIGAMQGIYPVLSIMALAITVLSAVLILTCPPVITVCDTSSELLERRRVRAGGVIVVLFATASMFNGQAGLLGALPVWAVLVGLIEARIMPRRKQA
jgi:hypothetical protein